MPRKELMTKKELIDFLQNVSDDATICIATLDENTGAYLLNDVSEIILMKTSLFPPGAAKSDEVVFYPTKGRIAFSSLIATKTVTVSGAEGCDA